MLATIVLEMSKKNLFSKIDGDAPNRFDSDFVSRYEYVVGPVAGDSDSYIITKNREPGQFAVRAGSPPP